jgi:hypothetical protein
MLEIVTEPVVSPVLSRLTMDVGEEGWTDFTNKRLGSINEREAVLDFVNGETIPGIFTLVVN